MLLLTLLVVFTSGEVETCLERISQKASWLQDVRKTDALNELFSCSLQALAIFSFCFTDDYYFHNMYLSLLS